VERLLSMSKRGAIKAQIASRPVLLHVYETLHVLNASYSTFDPSWSIIHVDEQCWHILSLPDSIADDISKLLEYSLVKAHPRPPSQTIRPPSQTDRGSSPTHP